MSYKHKHEDDFNRTGQLRFSPQEEERANKVFLLVTVVALIAFATGVLLTATVGPLIIEAINNSK